jgi:thiosulfate/3-mercaptopyruvate sulfurtransferase
MMHFKVLVIAFAFLTVSAFAQDLPAPSDEQGFPESTGIIDEGELETILQSLSTEILLPEPEEELLPPYPNSQFLVETEWLSDNFEDPDLRIIDVRSSARFFLDGHIPGATFVELDQLRREFGGVKGVIKTVKVIEKYLGSFGIDHDTMVIIYDDNRGLNASYLFWLLDYMGHEHMAILNGGMEKWVLEELPVEVEVKEVERKSFFAKMNRNKRVNTNWILNNLKNPDVSIVDGRSKLEYLGFYQLSKKGGHIPGAVNIEWKKHITNDPLILFKSGEDLKNLYEEEGVTSSKIVVVYAQTLFRATLNYFSLRLLDYDVRAYERSWEEWGNRDDLPAER